MNYPFFILAGYLCGSVLFGKLFSIQFGNVDIQVVSEDKNPGTYNAFHYGGFFCGVLTLLADLMKGCLPVFLCFRILGPDSILFSLVMAAPVFGHAFSLLNHGRGGKAIAVSFGVLLGLLPGYPIVFILVFFYLLFSLLIRLNPHSKRSVLTFSCFLLTCLATVKNPAILGGCFLIAGIVIYKHLKIPEELRSNG